MITSGDITFMNDAQDEMYELRKRPITVIYDDIQYDDFTNEEIGNVPVSREVEAVVTEISTKSVNGSRFVVGGIEFDQGDIKVDVKVQYIEDIIDKITRLSYNGKQYEILGDDGKGIGKRNRYEIKGRVIA
ncbi:hypothetical protein I2483_13625 [Sporosarcina sp. E16_3]|uniref:hypothetical protein n=1 Tax=Sporosarcina sp. E16_3 TaxID=2789293 RepID=UPI001A9321E5|nr:hypothetical protein [Sporosarcina sp. E16_3]MBO0602702.1 hypothetical protein [Sporosarcina sp. E16_3]